MALAQAPAIGGEYRLLVAAANPSKHGFPQDLQLDWDAVLRLSTHHRLGELLHQHLECTGHAAPGFALERLRAQRERTAVAELGARQQLAEVAEILSAAGLRAVALKGAALIESVYPEVGLRPMSDLDLLVGEEAVEGAARALAAAGYRRHRNARAPIAGIELGRFHHHYPLSHPERPLAVELHRRAASALECASFGDFLERAVPSSRGAHLLPDPGDHLIVLAAHFLNDRQAGSPTALGQLADIARVLARCEIDFDSLARRARSWALAGEVSTVLCAVRELGLAAVPDDALGALGSKPSEAVLVSRLLSERVLVLAPRLPLDQRFPASARQFLLPGGAYMRERYNLPHASLARLYLERARTARRLLAPILRHPRRALADLTLARQLRRR